MAQGIYEDANIHKFVPFYEWETNEYHSKYLNVNSEGVRKTWNPENIKGKNQITVYVFGGSTILGAGARDNYTIPSYLSKKLNKVGNNNYIVSNYGGDAYTFPQEIIRLIVLLNKAHRPRYVIFYDGVNDVYAAYQSGVPGSIQNVKQMAHQLESKPPRLFWEWMCYKLRHNIMLVRGALKLKNILSHLNKPEVYETYEEASTYDDNQLKMLSQKIADSYLVWKDMLDYLSKSYNFQYYCFWQPVIYTEDKIFPGDALGDARLNDKSLAKLYKNTNLFLKEKSVSHFWNISNILSERTGPCYYDICHITESGNDMVAEKIYKTLNLLK